MRVCSLRPALAVAVPADSFADGARELRASLCCFLSGGVSRWVRQFLVCSVSWLLVVARVLCDGRFVQVVQVWQLL